MATCVPDNNKKGYDCLCFDGFEGNGNKQANVDGRGGKKVFKLLFIMSKLINNFKGCHDINECATFNKCDASGQNCINTFGSFVCSTVPDPDHVCHKGQHDCHELAKCIPNPKRHRKYDCECVAGYKGNGNAQFILGDPTIIQADSPLSFGPNGPQGCVDIDECKENSHNCVAQSCFNQPGSFYCSADPDPKGVCDAGQHECHPNALCVVSASNRGYDCVCKAGLEGNGNALWSRNDGFFDTIAMGSRSNKKGCWDIDECKTNAHNCVPNLQICHNVHANQGKYLCLDQPGAIVEPCLNNNHMCPMGYSCYRQNFAPFYSCVDNNECSLGTHECTIHQDCNNIPGTYECLGLADPNDVCTSFNPCANRADGMTRCEVMYNTYQCVDRDECFDGSHTCHYTEYCVDIPGSFICKPPYDPDPYELCTDFVCQADASCSLSVDKKTRQCLCNPGYQLDTNGLCADIDECLNSPCPDYCLNKPGTFECMTPTAFSDFMCSLVTDPCGTVDTKAQCIGQGTMAAPITLCICSTGFEQDASGKCVDTLECAAVGCGPGMFCLEQIGNSQICEDATLNPDPLNVCSPNNPCGLHGTCTVTPPNATVYSCTCDPGYDYLPINSGVSTCMDVDECADPTTNTCTVFEHCSNLPGSYVCQHNPDPFGKCMGFNNKCTGMANCVVSADKLSSSCECPTGFYWGQDFDGAWDCQDIDECSTGTHTCSAFEYCANMPGTFYCGRHSGPCAYGAHDCHPMAVCRPSYAKRGYDCDCITGYTGNGNDNTNKRHLILDSNGKPIDHSHGSLIAYGPNGPKGCVDVDECKAGIAQCVAGQVCVNSIGGFKCTNEYDPWGKCAEGAHECHPLAVCSPNANKKIGYDCTCKAGFAGNGMFQFGRTDAIALGTGNTKGCVDVNECATGRAMCSTYQTCVNLEGGYSCIGDFDPAGKCTSGGKCSALQNCIPNAYTHQGYSCQDKDECLDGSHTCTVNQLCTNINYGDGFKCMGAPDPYTKCAPGTEGDKTCSAQKASCMPDNSAKGYACNDIDECAAGNPCSTGENCINKANGFFCTPSNDPFNVCLSITCGPFASCSAGSDFMTPTCSCNSGFMPDPINNDCIDIDECSNPLLNNCTTLDFCVNKPGSFDCSSSPDPLGLCDPSMTQCNLMKSDCTVDVNDKTQFACDCHPGYNQIDTTTCIDIDECATNDGGCKPFDPTLPSYCVNEEGTFHCNTTADPYGVCQPLSLGHVACFLNTDPTSPCTPNDADKRMTYICNCAAGYEATGIHGSCVDIDECVTNVTACTHLTDTVCVNTDGSFSCLNTTDPHGVCAPGAHKCGPYGTCDVIGVNKDQYTCQCQLGFELDANGQTCQDTNECAPMGGAACDPSQDICLNTIGSYICTSQGDLDPNGLCDPTQPNSVVCIGPSATCAVSNDKLSAYCSCPPGFYYSQSHGCVDVDECQFEMMNLCVNTEKCLNTIGSYQCQIHPDPQGVCSGATKCDPRADCVPNMNTKRGYDCICRSGYYGKGNYQFSRNDLAFGSNGPKGCVDIDECTQNLHNCAATNQYCENNDGGYKCTSQPNPDHPCNTGAHVCHHLATCSISYSNKIGYTCTCNAGFKGNGKKQVSDITGAEIAFGGPKGCVDVDECKFNLDNCATGQSCSNTIGSFQCFGVAADDPCNGMMCPDGLQCALDMATGQSGCADINECLNFNICPTGTHCVNNYQSYKCVPDSVPTNPCSAGTHSCNHLQECTAQGNIAICTDRDECTTAGHDCNAFETCYNTDPGWMCFNDGNSVCRGNFCHHKATCIANPLMKDGYECVCNNGYHGNGNRQFRFGSNEIAFGPNGPKGCVDVNECESSIFPCKTGEACVNNDGGYSCIPVMDNTDIFGHCSFGAHQCDDLALCVPNLGAKRGYDCVCRSGYTGNGNQQMTSELNGMIVAGEKGCVDVDECKNPTETRCSAWQICVNTIGSYQCVGSTDPYEVCKANPCQVGFDCEAVQTYKGYKCEDKNECLDGTHLCSTMQICVNYPGAYACHNTTFNQMITVIGEPIGPNEVPTNTAEEQALMTAKVCANVNCAAGWECVQVGVIGKCMDINECYANDTACAWGEICSNYPGGYLCLEDPDYVCRHGAHSCSKEATCVPLQEPQQGHKDGYDCLCPDGYYGNGNNKPLADGARFDKPKGCHDINECLDVPCAAAETCLNTPGSFICYDYAADPFLYETPCTYNDCDLNANCVLNNYANDRGYDCQCKAGYKGNGNAQYSRTDISRGVNGPKGCVNVDECDIGSHDCGFTFGCIDTEGSFLCIPDPYGVCLAGKHSCNEYSSCRPKQGQLWDHVCECRVGATDSCMEKCGTTWSFCYKQCVMVAGGSGHVCQDVDECGKMIHDCPTNTTCVNDFPGFACSTADDPFGLCLPANNFGGCDQVSTNCTVDAVDKNKVICVCQTGFSQLNATEPCIDDDECQLMSHNCNATETCINTPGSFDCSLLNDPYHLCDGLGAPHTCGNFTCELTGDKKDYYCDCTPFSWYDAVSKTCKDIDECKNLPSDPSWTDPCNSAAVIASGNGLAFCINNDNANVTCSMAQDPLGVCVGLNCGDAIAGQCLAYDVSSSPLWKTYPICTCNPGFVNKKSGDQTSPCVDTDDCINQNTCKAPGATWMNTTDIAGAIASGDYFCVNTPGSYYCTGLADPLNTCADGNHNCGWRGTCQPERDDPSEYVCGCEQGYSDICEDACKLSFDPFCYSNCIKSLFGKQRCKNVNECDEYRPSHSCLGSEQCVDLDGSFDCLDKCELSDVCHPNATCIADYSSQGYHCQCPSGYHGNGKKQKDEEVVGGLFGAGAYKVPKGCVDIDECKFGIHNCTGNEVCVNKDGHFECSTDHDPHGACLHNAHECHPLATCVPNHDNKRGYDCECDTGYYGNGNFQYVFDSGRKRRLAEGISYLSAERSGLPVDEAAEYMKSIPAFDEVVASGENAPKGCINIDECYYNMDDCTASEVCFDTVGSWICAPATTTPAPPTLAPTICFMAQVKSLNSDGKISHSSKYLFFK